MDKHSILTGTKCDPSRRAVTTRRPVAAPLGASTREPTGGPTGGETRGATCAIDFDGCAVLPILRDFERTFDPGMAQQTKRIELTLESVLESVDLAESIAMRISAAAGFSEEECHKIGMAVREGVINAYNYGNEGDSAKKIFMTIEFDGERMIVHVVDQGKGFELADVADCLSEENLLRTSGRGIFLMKAFMDEFDVKHAHEGGAELIMAKRLPVAPRENGSRPAARDKES
ncbi:MAG: ATP-binding protein [Candidatus Acidiferrales bacterium]